MRIWPLSGDGRVLQPPPQPKTGRPWLWILGYLATALLLSREALTPLVPGTSFSLMSLPLAVLAFFLMVRPWREAPIYALIHFLVGVEVHTGIRFPPFNAMRVGMEVIEAVVMVRILLDHYIRRLADPLFVALYTLTVIMVTGLTGFVLISLTELFPRFGLAAPPILIEQPALGWRYWMLGHACSYLLLAGPMAVVVTFWHRLAPTLRNAGPDRRSFIGLTTMLFLVSLLAFPVVNITGLGIPVEVRQALHFLPLPIVVAMAARFRAKGSAVALLAVTIIVILSLTGPSAEANWAGLPPTATPTQVLLLITATAAMVTGAMSRQVLKATAEAIEARQIKSRFVNMLNHELRTPLNAILGFSELMRMQKIDDLDAAMGPLENIHASGQRLLAVIEGLLGQADQGASAFELHKHPLLLKETVSAVIEELQADAEAFRFPVVFDIPEGLGIEADERALRQILMVLLAHPLRFVTPWTQVRVSARQSGTDTLLDIHSEGLVGAVDDERDRLELQLAKALALAHGARLTIEGASRDSRLARLTFFATRAAA